MLVEFRQASVLQMLANCGYDTVIIDNEHGQFSVSDLAVLSRGARAVGLTPIVRITDPESYKEIAQALDGGAQGIMYPRVVSAAQVQRIVRMTKYPPEGERGNALTRSYTDWKSGDVMQVMRAHNAETLVVIQIENRAALDALDAILAVPGVDIALVGPNDLSIALGVPGQSDHPLMRDAMERVIASCRKHGVTPALHINDLKLAEKWAQAGVQLVSVSAEVGLLMSAGTQHVTALRAAVAKK